MKKYALLAATAAVGGVAAFQGSVLLQGSTPGTAQTGNLHITGKAKAGVFEAISTAPTGLTYGGDFRSASSSGRGVLGNASATSGATYGGLFQAASNAGRAVAGIAGSSTGTTYGGFFSSLSNQGRGVYGQATSASGTTYGVYGKATSTAGYGVYSEGNLHATGVISGNGSGLTNLALPVPLNLTGGGPHVIRATSTGGGGAAAVLGISNFGNGGSGGRFESNSEDAHALEGISTTPFGPTAGVFGQSTSNEGYGLFGSVPSSSGSTFGVVGQTNSSSGIGVFGKSTSTTGATPGVSGEAFSNGGVGVIGVAHHTQGFTRGLIGETKSSVGYGVHGISSHTGGGNTFGVMGEAEGTAASGVLGYAMGGSSYGIRGQAHPDTGTAVLSAGKLVATGTKSFRIEHPFDPENKYLLHYCAESPMPQNFYVGNVVTDAQGYAWVDLPDYFEEINKNFKYQLTVVGKSFARAIIWEEIVNGRFQIRTDEPRVKVSWRVDADRNDLYVRNHPPKDVMDKPDAEKGTYQYPEFYGIAPERGTFYIPKRPRALKSGK